MKRAILTALTSAILFTSPIWSQTINGTNQGGLVLPGNTWNQHPFGIMDYSTGVFRFYWSCGNPDGICVGHATSLTFYDSEPVSVNNAPPSVCDIQDPGIVKFQGTYFLYAAGITPGAPPNAGCNNEQGAGNEHAAIYAFTSSDGVHFSPANNGNPVIQVPGDPCWTCYTGHGINGPSPVVMGSGSFIRVYYFINAPGYGVISTGIEAMDSSDGLHFSNERAIMTSGYWPCVKRVGLFGDYPMVMTYTTGSGAMTATSSSSSDTFWTIGNGGSPISANPAYGYPPRLESDETGLFLNANGAAFTSPVSGQINFDWDNGANGVPLFGTRIFRGLGNAAQFFNF